MAPAVTPTGELTISKRVGEDRITLELRGELDLRSAPALRDRVEALPSSMLVMDLRGLSFIDSAGLAALVAAQRRARREHRTIRFVTASDTPIARVLNASGLAAALDTTEVPEPGRRG